MANKIIFPQDFSQYDFVAMSRKEPNAKNRLRLLAMANIQEGTPLTQIASTLKVHWKTIQAWVARFRQGGIAKLYVKNTRIRTHKINTNIENWIKQFLNALNCNDQGGHITGKQLHNANSG
jgi:transposase